MKYTLKKIEKSHLHSEFGICITRTAKEVRDKINELSKGFDEFLDEKIEILMGESSAQEIADRYADRFDDKTEQDEDGDMYDSHFYDRIYDACSEIENWLTDEEHLED